MYGKFAIEAEVEAFWPDMPADARWQQLGRFVRTGGTTLAELAAAGTPALLLPYPQAADDHQRRNAEAYVAAAGAAQMLDEPRIDQDLDDQLAEMLVQPPDDANCRMLLGQGMHRLARPRVAAHVANLVWSLVTSQAHSKRTKVAA